MNAIQVSELIKEAGIAGIDIKFTKENEIEGREDITDLIIKEISKLKVNKQIDMYVLSSDMTGMQRNEFDSLREPEK